MEEENGNEQIIGSTEYNVTEKTKDWETRTPLKTCIFNK